MIVPHETWMEQALREAEKAFEKNEVPVGAVVIEHDRIIGRGHNLVEGLQDPTAHAEIIAITAAANSMSSWRLEDTTLYVTKEPCPMCAGAIYLSRVSKVVCGVRDERMGAGGSAVDILNNENLRASIPIEFGILESKSLGILQAFFQKLRNK